MTFVWNPLDRTCNLNLKIPPQYAQPDGKTSEAMYAELYAVFIKYPEYSTPKALGYNSGGEEADFLAMVRKFAADSFYHEHYVAKAYLAWILPQ